MTNPATGGCLCGAVRFTATVPERAVQACHCGQCRRWTGGGPFYAVRVRDIAFTSADQIAAYHASGHGERAHCRVCGTILYWRLQGRSVAFVAAGMLDDQSDLTITEDIFCDRAADWTPRAPGARQSTERQMMDQLDAFLRGQTP